MLCWIGLNPGTGDSDGKPRPTLGRVEQWARRWHLDGVLVVNLFAFRTTRPAVLRTTQADIIGGQNDLVIDWASAVSERTLAAWGADGRLFGRGAQVGQRLDGATCLGLTKLGQPRHPLYVTGDVEPMPLLMSSDAL